MVVGGVGACCHDIWWYGTGEEVCNIHGVWEGGWWSVGWGHVATTYGGMGLEKRCVTFTGCGRVGGGRWGGGMLVSLCM